MDKKRVTLFLIKLTRDIEKILRKGNDMSKLTFGVIGTSKKIDERRIPIHPAHFSRIPNQFGAN